MPITRYKPPVLSNSFERYVAQVLTEMNDDYYQKYEIRYSDGKYHSVAMI